MTYSLYSPGFIPEGTDDECTGPGRPLAAPATAGDLMDIRREMDSWVRQWRIPMLRFARLHLSHHEDAEDAVQETFAAVLQADADTLKAADPRRYLFGILRHKITDRLRQRYRQPQGVNAADEDDLDSLLFDQRDHWLTGVAPARWSTPDSRAEGDQFFRLVDLCVNNLPAKPARVFSMKEFLECDPEEICATLGISKPDYWQCLSRARKQLHLCLNQKGFGGNTL